MQITLYISSTSQLLHILHSHASLLNTLLRMPHTLDTSFLLRYTHDATHTRYMRSSRMYSYGEYKAEDQEKMLADLDKKVADVYANCIGANEANIL